MLLVHAELCRRAGISIDWPRTCKQDYLDALTREIEAPNDGRLDAYLANFIDLPIPRDRWLESIAMLPGLDGAEIALDIASRYSDPRVAEACAEFERKRAYRFRSSE